MHNTIKNIMFEGISKEWISILDNNLLDDIITEIKPLNYTPKADKIFEFARLTPINNIKILILGQDPYPTEGEAHGLAFSSKFSVPRSLKNIYKMLLHTEETRDMNKIGDLSFWAIQGVLLMNSALTTIVGEMGSHVKLWKSYTALVLTNIATKYQSHSYKPISILLGGKAKKNDKYLDTFTNLYYAHPSPLAQSVPFIECPHFTNANHLLVAQDVKAINWNIPIITDKVLKGFVCDIRTSVAFTDGSCYPNVKNDSAVAGYAVCFAMGKHTDNIIYGNCDNSVEFTSNIRSEGYAIYQAMLFMGDGDDWDKLIIMTDCQFWIDMFYNYMPMWESIRVGFDEKKNSDLTIPMYELYKKLTKTKVVQLRHIKSHNKNGWLSYPQDSYEYFCAVNNEYVDGLAGYARKNVQKGVDCFGMV